jgi:hypothetical protein
MFFDAGIAIRQPDIPGGASIAGLLEVLIRATVEYPHGDARAAIYLADADRRTFTTSLECLRPMFGTSMAL